MTTGNRNMRLLKNKWYIDYISKMTPDEILPGSLRFINELRNANIRVAIGSASKNTPLILEQSWYSGIYLMLLQTGTMSERQNPIRKFSIKLPDMLGIKPENCVVFEDAIAGVQAALNAGMMCIGVGSPNILTKAHFVVSGLNEMNMEKLSTIEKDIRL